MGVLDSFFSDNPNDAAYTALMAGLLSGKGSFGSIAGNSLLGAQGAYSQANSNQLKNQATKLQIEEMARKLKSQQQAEADAEAFRAKFMSMGSPQMRASQAALAGGGGPTVDNAAKISPVDPMTQMLYDAVAHRQATPLQFAQLTQKDNSPLIVPADSAVLDRATKKPIYTNTKTDKNLTDDIKEFNFATQRGEVPDGMTFTEWLRANKKAGATNLSVSADRGFAGAFGKNAADALQAASDAAVSAQASNSTIADIRDAMKSGSVILGPGATVRQVFARAGQIIGAGTPESAQALANTKKVEQGLARIELEAANLIKGQGQVTENERKIVQRAAAGQIQDLTPAELEVALRAIERNNNTKIKFHETKAKVVRSNPAVGSLGGLLENPTANQTLDWSQLK